MKTQKVVPLRNICGLENQEEAARIEGA